MGKFGPTYGLILWVGWLTVRKVISKLDHIDGKIDGHGRRLSNVETVLVDRDCAIWRDTPEGKQLVAYHPPGGLNGINGGCAK